MKNIVKHYKYIESGHRTNIFIAEPLFFWKVRSFKVREVLISRFGFANISLWEIIDKLQSWVIDSSEMHKVYRCYQRPLTDSNFLKLYSFWCRITRKLIPVATGASLKFGKYSNTGEIEQIIGISKASFEPYRVREGSASNKKNC